MKVLCIKLPGPALGAVADSTPWLTVHQTYIVTAVIAEPGGRVLLQIIADDGSSLAWFDSEAFLTVDPVIPGNWVLKVGEAGIVEISPAAWLEPGFWEKYYDGDPHAQQAVEEELRQITPN